MDMCYKKLDMNQKIIAIFFDLQKAFDTVNYPILLHKLYNCGVRGVMFNWIKNYLTDRKQYTVVNGVKSDIDDISCGVPQGSVLGPLLFLVYVNDIYKAVPDGELKLFADDTNLFLSGPNLQLLEKKANLCLKNMEEWFISNKLAINNDKTFYMVFSGKYSPDNDKLKLFINDKPLNKVSNCKYLGVHVDDSTKWNYHIDYVYNKLIKFTSIRYFIKYDIYCLNIACVNFIMHLFILI